MKQTPQVLESLPDVRIKITNDLERKEKEVFKGRKQTAKRKPEADERKRKYFDRKNEPRTTIQKLEQR